jgi:hypothetical protein
MTVLRRFALTLAAAAMLWPASAAAQGAQPPPDDPDLDLNFSQPDFTISTLPTTLRLPRFKSAFRVTHRFGRPLGQGDFGDLVEDLFGLDSGANIGLEYRFGLMRGLQIGVYRTNSEKTIEFFTQYSLLQQGEGSPLEVSAIASIEGTNNFVDTGDPNDPEDPEVLARYSPALGVVVAQELGNAGALYFQPVWVNNTNPEPAEVVDDNDTFLFGMSARIRIRPTVYLVGEFIPRVGNAPGPHFGMFGIEKRVGGHTFQLNFSNGVGTTMAQIARGGEEGDDWFLGFNISRKFF